MPRLLSDRDHDGLREVVRRFNSQTPLSNQYKRRRTAAPTKSKPGTSLVPFVYIAFDADQWMQIDGADLVFDTTLKEIIEQPSKFLGWLLRDVTSGEVEYEALGGNKKLSYTQNFSEIESNQDPITVLNHTSDQFRFPRNSISVGWAQKSSTLSEANPANVNSSIFFPAYDLIIPPSCSYTLGESSSS